MANMLKVVVLAMLCTSTVAMPVVPHVVHSDFDKLNFDKLHAASDKYASILNFDKLQATKHEINTPKPDNYAAECWTKAHLPIKADAMSLLQAHQAKNVPGAGIEKFKPFEEVLKDGFLTVKCVKDYMYYRGDKFGDNKHDYKLGPVSNVSIVHYNAFIAKEDRSPMTPARCFEFCRTVPNMGFFGIVNGRGCYCTPYFTSMESDSTQCDALCEGDKTKACGGKSKSSIFAMHFCDSTADDLKLRTDYAEVLEEQIDFAVKKAKIMSDDMQNLAAELQKSLGAVGDSGASNLMQEAKVWAGDLLHTADDTSSLVTTLQALQKDSEPLTNFADPATVTKAERIMEGVDGAAETGKGMMKKLMLQESQASGATSAQSVFELNAPHEPVEEEGAEVMEENYPNEAMNLGHAVSTNKYMYGPWKFLGFYASWCTSGDCSEPWPEDRCAKKAANTPECMGHYSRWSMSYDGKYHYWPHPYNYEYCYCIGAPIEEEKLNTCTWCDYSVKHNWHWQYTIQMWKFDVKVPFSSFDQYYPAMYFVNKDYENVPATCSGPLAAKPIVSGSKDACASACDLHIHSCVGFQYFKNNGKELCFLFSRFNTGSYYTGCGKSFLQSHDAKKAPYEAGCYAKLSKFVGTTLEPNPSGKCDQCFKELTKADRCFE